MSIAAEIKSTIPKLPAALHALSTKEQGKAVSAALNRTGDMVYTRVVRILAEETGAQQKRIRKILRKKGARPSSQEFAIYARDVFTSLKDFRPTKRKGGVAASPWGKQRLFPGTFLGPNDHVFRRIGKDRAIKKLWGPAIPREMIRGATGKATQEVIRDAFPKRIDHELSRALGVVKKENGL